MASGLSTVMFEYAWMFSGRDRHIQGNVVYCVIIKTVFDAHSIDYRSCKANW